MIDSHVHFQKLLDRLQRRDVTAAEELVERYGPHICRAIRRRFRTRKLQVLYSTEDCLQSVWQAVFVQMDRLARCTSPEHLLRYLTRIASNKLVDRDRHLRSQRNDIGRERPLFDSAIDECHRLVDPGCSPSAMAAVRDDWVQKTQGLSSERRNILQLRANGLSTREIAEQTGCSGRTIRRVLHQLGDLFSR